MKFKNNFYVEYHVNYLQTCANKRKLYDIFMKEITLILINFFDPCEEVVLGMHILFYFM